MAEVGRVGVIWDILSHATPADVDSALSRCGIIPTTDLVDSILALSYSSPAAAIKFFRWSGLSLNHTPGSWNLMVDILGRNALFEPMWDAIRSMKHHSALSLSTFASAFSAYCSASRFKEAVMSFDVMDRYGVPQDSLAVNSLLSALFQNPDPLSSQTAADFFDRIKSRVLPDPDTFDILLQGWERTGNVARAKNTFGEMVIRVGWEAATMSAFEAFLMTLIRGDQPDEAIKFLQVMKNNNRLPGIKFFASALDVLIDQNDSVHALALWEVMVVQGGLVPTHVMCNTIISQLCKSDMIQDAYNVFDGMTLNGVFPDSLPYNTIFECLIQNKRVHDAGSLFNEMRKNEQLPSPSNCASAIRMFFSEYNPIMAMEVWNYMLKEHVSPTDDAANEFLIGLKDLGRLSEVRYHAEFMLDKGIELHASTMDKLKAAFYKASKKDAYEHLARRKKHLL
ncbi:putative tetratricopeptide-like helical domain superfamily [Dioscorea sansibarensis]